MTNHDATDWRDALWATHASLFEGSSPFATGIGTLPVGWQELVESLCSRLAALARGAGARRGRRRRRRRAEPPATSGGCRRTNP
ncbi:hypothetical protein [Bradyrhizobium sp. WSM1743]|uniref:hypothetical protein n=1 Tax=Bradyrhizobium sp. WSM1743 TaxID=318996 RepID=UPI000489211F|nr:hypothetical protein [Bradyrhizobium sp. WSM1743]